VSPNTDTMTEPSNVVYVVDDDVSFLRAVSRFLRAAGHSVEVFESAKTFLERLTPEMSGCVVLDLQMPDVTGLELQEALSRTGNPLPVVFLTGQGDIPSTVRAMRGGAEDFLTKVAPQAELLAAITRAIARGVREREARSRARELSARFQKLSRRELEVLGHVIRGRMNKHIAAELSLNERTVKLHRTSITRKLGIRSVAELTRLADEAGIFSTPT
jgi:FixJ family two-component response regulator